jgi:IS30 family transposase
LKAKQTISEIVRFLGRSRCIISRELSYAQGQLGYLVEQAFSKESERSQRGSKARILDSKVWSDVGFYLSMLWTPKRIAGKVASAKSDLTMLARPLVEVYTFNCVAKIPGLKANCAGATGASIYPIAKRSAKGHEDSKQVGR